MYTISNNFTPNDMLQIDQPEIKKIAYTFYRNMVITMYNFIVLPYTHIHVYHIYPPCARACTRARTHIRTTHIHKHTHTHTHIHTIWKMRNDRCTYGRKVWMTDWLFARFASVLLIFIHVLLKSNSFHYRYCFTSSDELTTFSSNN